MSIQNTGKYTIINKDINNLVITGYTIQNEEGKTKVVKTADIVRLIRSGKIKNARVLLDTDSAEYIVDVDGGLINLPNNAKNKNKMTLLCRLIDGDKKCIGYKAQDINGKTYKLSINKIWELSTQGLIENYTGKIIGDVRAIISLTDQKLENLPKLYV